MLGLCRCRSVMAARRWYTARWYTAGRTKSRYNFNPDPFGYAEPPEDSSSFPLLDAAALSQRTTPPRRVRMLSRDYIQDSLYNPFYGYFATQVEIFDPERVDGRGIPFNDLRNTMAFEQEVAARYEQGEETAKEELGGAARQVWHTPTELFKPWYARAVARHIVATHIESGTKDRPLRIIEIGAGNGTLMTGILDYLASSHPDLYASTVYTAVEVSPRLAALQRSASRHHKSRVSVLQKSALLLTEAEGIAEDCFVIAAEVLDNLSHDVVRYLPDSLEPLQASVTVDSTGDFSETFSAALDPLLSRFLSLRSQLGRPHSRPRVLSAFEARARPWRLLKTNLPFAPNLSRPEFLPTRMLELLEVLRDRFPRHRLVISDFSSLPEAIQGANAPVVQTRYAGVTVPCTTYLVAPGFFDIFFPTDFALLAALHSALMPPGSPRLSVLSHADFLRQWGEPHQTRCQDGSNPMLDYYENVRVAVS